MSLRSHFGSLTSVCLKLAMSRPVDDFAATLAMPLIRALTDPDSSQPPLQRYSRECEHNHDHTHVGQQKLKNASTILHNAPTEGQCGCIL
jgi:hypothetical protein